MSDTMIGMVGIGGLLGLIALRAPIGLSLVLVSYLGLWAMSDHAAAWGMLQVVPFSFIANWTLSSVPMFLLMGFVCYRCGLTAGLFAAARLWFSRLPGGLAIASVFGCSGFAAVTGSSVACAAAMGKVAVPEMVKHRYDMGLATGTLAAAGTVGALIPPSILLIIFGVVAQVPITALFLAGLGVGIATSLTYVLVIIIRVKLNPSLAPQVTETVTRAQHWEAIKSTWPIVVLIVGVLGGMFAGLFTATQAGAVGAAMALLVAAVKRTLTRESFKLATVETLVTCGGLFIVIVGASMLTRFLTLSGVGEAIASGVDSLNAGPLTLLLGITVVYLALGMFLEPVGAMLITLPIFLPMIRGAEISLIWFGAYVAKMLEIGMITPPVGLNVFVLSSTIGKTAPTELIFRGIWWFFIADLLLVALIIFVPGIVLWFPGLFS
ncbi:TRAP transporter large permease [Piscinibacter sakaiensis]|uniref:TRAP transporter large permease n=1 Tax=Piscinibacter sakaiensis TaxID=1547922 RepID=UPI003AAE8387